jgi:hypothetical protein
MQHKELFNEMFHRLPAKAQDPNAGIKKEVLKEEIEKNAREVVRGAKHITCARKARALINAIKATAWKKLKRSSETQLWYLSI